MTTTIPTAPNFTAGSTPTAAQLNAFAAAINFWADPPAVETYLSAAQTTPSGVGTAISWDAEYFDYSDPMHSTVTNPTRLVAVATGRYLITGQVCFATNATGIRSVQFRLNAAGSYTGGTSIAYTSGPGNSVTNAVAATPVCYRDMVAGDYIELFINQTSGIALGISTTLANTFATMRLIGS